MAFREKVFVELCESFLMFESFIVMLREGLEIALIVSLVWAYLHKTNRDQLILAVVVGLAGGLLASLGIALALRSLDWSSPVVEGTMMFIGASFVGTMVVWMEFQARHMGKAIREKVDHIAADRSATRGTFWGIALFILIMVAREGFEAVVFLAAIWAGNHSTLGDVIGTAAGIILATVFGVLLIRGSLRIDLGRFFKITSIVLVLFILQMIAHGIHEFGKVGYMAWLPGMDMFHAIARQNTLFILAIVLIPVLMLLIPGHQREVTRRDWRYRVAAASVGMVVIAALLAYSVNGKTRPARLQAHHQVTHPQSHPVTSAVVEQHS